MRDTDTVRAAEARVIVERMRLGNLLVAQEMGVEIAPEHYAAVDARLCAASDAERAAREAAALGEDH